MYILFLLQIKKKVTVVKRKILKKNPEIEKKSILDRLSPKEIPKKESQGRIAVPNSQFLNKYINNIEAENQRQEDVASGKKVIFT